MCLMISLILCCLLQDSMLVIPPFPYCREEDAYDVPLEDSGCWYARLQLLFTSYLRPKDGRAQKNAHYRHCPGDIPYHMAFFSTFEEVKLPISRQMELAGVYIHVYTCYVQVLHSCTSTNMSVHSIYMSVLFCPILSMWSRFQMKGSTLESASFESNAKSLQCRRGIMCGLMAVSLAFCFASGSPQPAGQSMSYNLDPFNYSC